MIICKNPTMCDRNGKIEPCDKGKINCCRHCSESIECLKLVTGGNLCPYIFKESDLKDTCPFETRKED